MIRLKDLNVRDPFVYSENGTYYLYAASKDGDGFVCYKSTDMRSFLDPVTVFKAGDGFWATKDFWAPELHAYNGKYYLFASLKSDASSRGTQIFVSDRPDGEFAPLTDAPVTPQGWECLDGTLYVENGVPYIVFCREWLEITDGEMYIMQLTPDLKRAAGEPIKLFSASSAPWTRPLTGNSYITDGPFILKSEDGYKMLWSSFAESGYAMGLCESKSLFGPWTHAEKPINKNNGGHGMILRDGGKHYLVYHAPNEPAGLERVQMDEFEY